MQPINKTIDMNGTKLVIETGKIAKQAHGAAHVKVGETELLVTAVSSSEGREGIDFFPLTVDYQEKLYAAGRIPGNYFKREGRASERETLTSRLIDRSLRPLFPEGYYFETQVIATVLSADLVNDPDVHAITAASTALTISDIPFNGPIAGVRVGRVDGQLIANPTAEQRKLSDLDLVVSASKDAIVMVEGGAKEISEADMVEALFFAQQSAQPAIDAQLELQKEIGKAKRVFTTPSVNEALKAKVDAAALGPISKAFEIGEKQARYAALRAAKHEAIATLKADMGDDFAAAEGEIKSLIEDLKYHYVRNMVLDTKKRIGGRSYTEIRNITIEAGLLPRTHGSALFTRGETQGLVTVTLGTGDDEMRTETLSGDVTKRFMLQYNFPPFSVGEVKRMGSPGRREVGHGALAERALRYIMPDMAKFPYVVRAVSEILESNGSSSMASVCGGCLALMDAGVPIEAPVAGIAMGLIKEDDRIAILSDILGDEDHLGDMDFKVCGSAKGITAIQMDIKITGVSKDILTTALNQAREGRLHILDKMLASLPAPRAEISRFAPRITTIKIRPERIKDVIGPGGKVVRDIVARTGTSINIEDDGSISIASPNAEAIERAIKMIKNLTQEAEIGRVYLGTVRRLAEFGAFVELFPGTDGLVHVSELAEQRVENVSDIIKEGDEILVKVISVDRTGKIRLSRKEAMGLKEGDVVAPLPRPEREHSDRGDRRDRGGRDRDRGGDRDRRPRSRDRDRDHKSSDNQQSAPLTTHDAPKDE
ncbi:MAG: polyribonucleotide nucleotidyltransferase [Myxococcales bacterium]|jgi:polyribonucleotide nucleotidyltransferase|nr:polyribonucleotide nucleotidyltransferase [Myxococcales bacterium]